MTPHLGHAVRSYVERTLPPMALRMYDRHLVTCVTCRSAADQERRIMATLRGDASMVPGSLRASLMSLASAPMDLPEPADRGPRVPLGPFAAKATVPVRRDPVPTVAPATPALHLSPMRAAVVASLAAGASVAAAWGLAVGPHPGMGDGTAGLLPADGVTSIGAVSPAAPGVLPVSIPTASATSPATSAATSAATSPATSMATFAPPTAPATMITTVAVMSVLPGSGLAAAVIAARPQQAVATSNPVLVGPTLGTPMPVLRVGSAQSGP